MDKHGNPIRKPQSDREVLEALIRSELADFKGGLRAANDAELRRIVEAHCQPKVKFWRKASVGSIVAAVSLILWAVIRNPDFIDQKTQEFFKEKLVGTALTNTVETVISNRATVLVDQRLAPLEKRTVVLSNTILETKSALGTITGDISKKQVQLGGQRAGIRDQQRLQELLVGAQAGSPRDYQELKSLSRNPNELGTTARAACMDADQFFESYRYRLSPARIFTDSPACTKPAQSPIDETVGWLSDAEWTQRETAAIRLAIEKRANPVADLCEALFAETNLFAVARITRSLNEISRDYFDTLGVYAVRGWWNLNKKEPKYQSFFRPFSPYRNTLYDRATESEAAVGTLTRLIEAEPSAWHARCLRAGFYIQKGDFDSAEKELAEVEKAFSDYGSANVRATSQVNRRRQAGTQDRNSAIGVCGGAV